LNAYASSVNQNYTLSFSLLPSVFPQQIRRWGWMTTFHEVLFFLYIAACHMLNPLRSRSSLMSSVHLFRGLSLLLLPGNRVCNARNGSWSLCILSTCPNNLNLLRWIFSSTVSFCPSRFLISAFLCLSLLLTPSKPNRLINQLIYAVEIYRLSFFLIVQHSALYTRTDITKLSYNLFCVLCNSPIFPCFPSLPNIADAFPILRRISFLQLPFSVMDTTKIQSRSLGLVTLTVCEYPR